MRAEVIVTGTEILLGHVQDSHLGHLAARLGVLGVRIARQTVVPDGPAIGDALRDAIGRADLVLVTGGLGPTTDDVTRESAAELLGWPLEIDPGVERAIRERFARRGLPMAERNLRQAMVPRGATVLPNPHGPAPGLHLPATRHGGRVTPHMFLLPGPPRELRPMMDECVVPILRALLPGARPLEQRIYHVAGLGESHVEEKVGGALATVPGLEVGYCARPGEVDIRLLGGAEALRRADGIVRACLGQDLCGEAGQRLEETLLAQLVERGWTLALAESCSGGHLADRFTDVPGASAAFAAGYVTYSNRAKTEALGVPASLLAEHGAVSAPVAAAMAEGALRGAGADCALATTGIAGPGGAVPGKPVGTVFLALAGAGGPTEVRAEFFPGNREQFKRRAAQAAFDMLRRRLAGAAARLSEGRDWSKGEG